MTKSLAQEFNETAEAARSAYPSVLKNLVVVLAPSADNPVYVSPEIAAQLSASVDALRDTVETATQYIQAKNLGGFAKGAHNIGSTEVKLIALNSKVSGVFSEKYTPEMRALLVLDHEIGHHIVSNGSYANSHSYHLSELAADAFAMLRHIQRFGDKADYAGNRTNGIAAAIVVLADSDHYTSKAQAKAIQVSQETNITHLSIDDTARLAAEIAYETFQSDETLTKIRNAYLPVYIACVQHTGSLSQITEKFHAQDPDLYALICRETLTIMQKNKNDADILKAGKELMNYRPVKEFIKNKSKTDNDWNEKLAWLTSLDAPKKRRLRQRLGF